MPNHDLIAFMPSEDVNVADQDIRTIQAHGFTAVLSARPSGPILLPKSRRDVLSEAARRQAQLEGLMAFGPVLPVAPHIRVDPASIPATLAANAPLLRDLGTWLRGAIQFQITVTWQAAKAMRHFGRDPELAGLFETRRVEATTLDHAMTRLMQRLGREMRDILERVATDVIALPTSPDVLLNLCVLLQATDEAELDRAVASIDAIWSEGLTIRQIGPSPATSFALLHLSQIKAREAEHAKRTLGQWTDEVSDIAEARRAALRAPNANVSAIRNAAEVLEAYTRTSGLPFHLIRVHAQDQGEADVDRMAVA